MVDSNFNEKYTTTYNAVNAAVPCLQRNKFSAKLYQNKNKTKNSKYKKCMYPGV